MVFKSTDAKKVLTYVLEKYGTTPEFLWARSPGNAILRHKHNLKWYAALLSLPKKKLGIDRPGDIEILDVKGDPAMIDNLRDGKRFLPAYHMNKEHWMTLVLDGSIPMKEICSLIDLSFDITKK